MGSDLGLREELRNKRLDWGSKIGKWPSDTPIIIRPLKLFWPTATTTYLP